MSATRIVRRWWILPLVYLVHLLDERIFGDGTAAWATTYGGVDFTNEAWLAVNVASFALLFGAAFATDRRRFPEWVFATLAVHLLLHAFVHVGGTLARPVPFPGVLTSVVLLLPVSLVLLRRAARSLPRARFALGCGVGILTMQPIYDFLLRLLLD